MLGVRSFLDIDPPPFMSPVFRHEPYFEGGSVRRVISRSRRSADYNAIAFEAFYHGLGIVFPFAAMKSICSSKSSAWICLFEKFSIPSGRLLVTP